MVNFLLDTSIVVDVLRQYDPAQEWLSQQSSPGISSVIWIEVLQGVKNGQAQRLALEFLRDFERVDLTIEDMDWAIEQLIRYQLSHNIGGLDCLIAAASHRMQIPLYTMNLKHFTPLLGTLAQKPY